MQGGDFSGVISGAGGLTKTGAASALTLSSANTYTGPTEVQAGTLTLSGAGDIASSTLALHGASRFIRGNAALTNLSRLDVYGNAEWNGAMDMTGTGKSMNFYIPATMTVGGTMLTVNGNVTIAGATIRVGVNGASSALALGEKVTLIESTATLSSDHDGTRAEGIQDIANVYKFDLTADATTLYATAAEVASNEQVKALSEGRVAGLAFVGQGVDMIVGPGMDNLVSSAQRKGNGNGFVPFGAVSGASARYKSGSHVDVDGVSLLAGLGWRAPLPDRRGIL